MCGSNDWGREELFQGTPLARAIRRATLPEMID